MADVSKFSPDGGLTIYNIKDTVARTVMTGASASSAGAAGQVPAPSAGDNAKFLRGDGAWVDAGSGGGHTILNSSGASMTQRSKLQFKGATVTDDSANNKTVVTVSSGGSIEWNYIGEKTANVLSDLDNWYFNVPANTNELLIQWLLGIQTTTDLPVGIDPAAPTKTNCDTLCHGIESIPWKIIVNYKFSEISSYGFDGIYTVPANPKRFVSARFKADDSNNTIRFYDIWTNNLINDSGNTYVCLWRYGGNPNYLRSIFATNPSGPHYNKIRCWYR